METEKEVTEKEVLNILREILSKIGAIETLLKKLSYASDDGFEMEKKIRPYFDNLKARLEVFYYDRLP